MMRLSLIITAGLLVACTVSTPAHAHGQSSSRLQLDLVDAVPRTLTLRLALLDLLHLLDLDGNRDGQLTWGEIAASEQRILDLVTASLSLRSGASDCNLSAKDNATSLTTLEDSPAIRVTLQVECPVAPDRGELHLAYQLFFDVDPTHRALVTVQRGEDEQSFLLTGDQRELTLADMNELGR